LASRRQLLHGEEHFLARDGADEEFDPARHAQYAFRQEGLHRGLSTESLVDVLLNAGDEISDTMQVPCSDAERHMLAAILLKEDEEELTQERLEGAARALRRIHLRRQQEQVQRELKKPGVSDDRERMIELLREAQRIGYALRDPGLEEVGENSKNKKKTA
jgi:hypothetical protein